MAMPSFGKIGCVQAHEVGLQVLVPELDLPARVADLLGEDAGAVLRETQAVRMCADGGEGQAGAPGQELVAERAGADHEIGDVARRELDPHPAQPGARVIDHAMYLEWLLGWCGNAQLAVTSSHLRGEADRRNAAKAVE